MILAPLRGVTIRTFRQTFAPQLLEYGFTEAVTPFITANAGVDPLKDRELKGAECLDETGLKITPQFIGKDPQALAYCLKRVKESGYLTADLNCGCPFPMVRNKFRGSGIIKTRDVFLRMVEVGCEVMGPNAFSIKARLGVDGKDELLALMDEINKFPLRFLVVHARTARQMYEGECDLGAFANIANVAKVPLVYNGDAEVVNGNVVLPHKADFSSWGLYDFMIGRGFIKSLAMRDDVGELLLKYVQASRLELAGDRPVLGRLKELLAYWKDFPRWKGIWQVAKIARTTDELVDVCVSR